MATYIDDNFGTYDMQDEEDLEFYQRVQRESRRKKCRGCGYWVKLLPQYAYCDGCATKREQGYDI